MKAENLDGSTYPIGTIRHCRVHVEVGDHWREVGAKYIQRAEVHDAELSDWHSFAQHAEQVVVAEEWWPLLEGLAEGDGRVRLMVQGWTGTRDRVLYRRFTFVSPLLEEGKVKGKPDEKGVQVILVPE